jgi:hypothetical protein
MEVRPALDYLRMHERIPQRDVRKLLWRYLNVYDREMVMCAHNCLRSPRARYGLVDHCVANGFLGILQYYGADRLMQAALAHSHTYICTIVIMRGDFDTLKWLQENKIVSVANGQLKVLAAQRGRVDILQLLMEIAPRWNDEICGVAKRYGHINVLEWAKNNWFHRDSCPYC